MKRLAFLAMVFLPSLAAAQVPGTLGYQGRLLKADGSPETGVISMTFRVFAGETGGTGLWEETLDVPVTDGFYAVYLGETTPLTTTVFDGNDRWLELEMGGKAFSPRQKIASVPYALLAGTAKNLKGGTVDATSLSVNGQAVTDSNGKLDLSKVSGCANSGEFLKWSGTAWTCEAIASTVSASAPFTGNGSAATPLALAAASGSADGYLKKEDWMTFNNKVSALDNTDGMLDLTSGAAGVTVAVSSDLLEILKASCTDGQILKWSGSEWACAADGGATYTAGTNGGIAISPQNAVSLMTCADGQVLKYTAANGWVCATDQTVGGPAGGVAHINGTAGDVVLDSADGSILVTTNAVDTVHLGVAFGTTATTAAAGNHTHSIYPLKTDLSAAGTFNAASNPVDWSQLKNVPAASATANGYLSSANWTTFNNKVGSVSSTTQALVVTGGTTTAPSLSLTVGTAANSVAAGNHNHTGTYPAVSEVWHRIHDADVSASNFVDVPVSSTGVRAFRVYFEGSLAVNGDDQFIGLQLNGSGSGYASVSFCDVDGGLNPGGQGSSAFMLGRTAYVTGSNVALEYEITLPPSNSAQPNRYPVGRGTLIHANDRADPGYYLHRGHGVWRNQAAVTSIQLRVVDANTVTGTFNQGTLTGHLQVFARR